MIDIATTVNAPLQDVWDKYISVDGVQHWGFASDEWAAEGIENDVREGGSFKNRNFAKDGSMEFEFGGVYDEVVPQKKLAYTLGDGRKVVTTFTETPEGVTIEQSFDAESEHPEEFQRAGWQGYLDNFKKYAEA